MNEWSASITAAVLVIVKVEEARKEARIGL